MSMLILDIGCGKHPHPNANVTVDLKAEVQPTLICDIRKLPFQDEIFDGLYAWEIIEHVGPSELHPLVSEWVRVLKHGGFIDIKTPDYWRWCLIFVVTYPFMKQYHYQRTVETVHPGELFDEDYHKSFLTRDSLKRLLITHEIDNITFSNDNVQYWKGIIARQIHYIGRKR